MQFICLHPRLMLRGIFIEGSQIWFSIYFCLRRNRRIPGVYCWMEFDTRVHHRSSKYIKRPEFIHRCDCQRHDEKQFQTYCAYLMELFVELFRFLRLWLPAVNWTRISIWAEKISRCQQCILCCESWRSRLRDRCCDL